MRVTSFLLVVSLFTGTLMAQRQRREPPRIAEWTGKTIMVFGAHPDDMRDGKPREASRHYSGGPDGAGS